MTDNVIHLEEDNKALKEYAQTKESMKARVIDLKNEKKKLEKDIRDWEKTDPTKTPHKEEELDKRYEQRKELDCQIIDAESDLKRLNRTRDDENEESIQAALHSVAENYIKKNPSAAYIIDQQQFMYIKEYSTTLEKQNVLMNYLDPAKFIEVLANDLGLCAWHLPQQRLKNLFNSLNRTFELSRYTLDNSRWGDSKVYLPLDHLREHFIDRVAVAEPIDKNMLAHFDCLMHSLSGGRDENLKISLALE